MASFIKKSNHGDKLHPKPPSRKKISDLRVTCSRKFYIFEVLQSRNSFATTCRLVSSRRFWIFSFQKIKKKKPIDTFDVPQICKNKTALTPVTLRSLVLITKILQNVANNVEFGKHKGLSKPKKKISHPKHYFFLCFLATEAYMVEVNSLIKSSIIPVKQFFEAIAQKETTNSPSDLPIFKNEQIHQFVNFIYEQIKFHKDKITPFLASSQSVKKKKSPSITITTKWSLISLYFFF